MYLSYDGMWMYDMYNLPKSFGKQEKSLEIIEIN